ncbi:MAG TPA: GNAT family N-acetyltransferase [Candidatus Choladousia intestinigallinarum]|nr:GNAT family N-acetyltransferase [Candidatus Choladousia intestinigallinarum]
MIYPETEFIMKNGEKAILRSPSVWDASDMLEYIRQMSAETIFVGRYPEEICETLADEESFLEECQKSSSSIQISAFVNGKLAGNASVEPVSQRIKMRHRAEFGIAVLEDYWGLGLGNALTFACLDMAEKMGFTQIELSMLEKNVKGLSLYEKAGFRQWGKLERCFRLKDGTFETGIYMVKEF